MLRWYNEDMRSCTSAALALLLTALYALPASAAHLRRPAHAAPHKAAHVDLGAAMDTPSDALVETVASTPVLDGTRPFTDTINWTKRVITVMGIGVSPERGTLLVRRKVAEAYALDDAMRELSEVASKIRVDGDATVGDLALSDDSIQAQVNERIAQAQASDTHVLPDGSVEVTLQLPLFGENGLAGAVVANQPSPIVFASDSSDSAPVSTSPYTGIVLDARNAAAQPALAPQIGSIDGQSLPGNPPVAYVHTMQAAIDLAGSHALKLSVNRAAGSTRSNLLLSDSAFGRLKTAYAAGGLSLVIIL